MLNYIDAYIQEVALNSYKSLVRPEKVQGVSDIEIMAKMRRDMAIGKHVYTRMDGARLYQYYDLIFVVHGFRLVKVYRDIHNKPYIVPKSTKDEYTKMIEEDWAC